MNDEPQRSLAEHLCTRLTQKSGIHFPCLGRYCIEGVDRK